MIKGWITSVSSKLSRALGGALDAEIESEEDVNTSSEIEHIEEGELAEGTSDVPKKLTPEEGDDTVPKDVTPGKESGGQVVTTEDALDSRNVPPVMHNTSGTCVDICPDEITNQIEDEGAGSFIVVREDEELKKPVGMDNSAWENISMVQESSPEKAVSSSKSSPIRVESSKSSPVRVESSKTSLVQVETSESSPEKPLDSSGSIEVIHLEDSDLLPEGKDGQPRKSVTESIVIIDEEVEGHSEPQCGTDLAVTAAMMESVCRDLDSANLSKTEETDSKAEGTESSESLTNKQGSEETVISEEVRNRKISEVQEVSMILSEEDTSINVEEVSLKTLPCKADDDRNREEQNFNKQQKKENASEKQEEEIKLDVEPKTMRELEKKKSTETENYLDFVLQKTAQGEVVPAKHLIYKLGLLNVDQKIIESAILDQYKIAVKRKYVVWIDHCRYHAELLFSPPWIADHLPKLGSKSSIEKKRWQARNQRRAKRWEKEASGMCRDVRLESDPTIDVVRENAASDREKDTVETSADQKTTDTLSEADTPSEELSEKVQAEAEDATTGEIKIEERVTEGPADKSSANQENRDNLSEEQGEIAQHNVAESSAKLVNLPPADMDKADIQKTDTLIGEEEFRENHDRKVCETSNVPSAEPSNIPAKLNETGCGNLSRPEVVAEQVDDVKHRKKVSPCKKGKSVKAREIDLSASRREGMETIEEKEFHSGRERRKSDLYEKRKDRVDDSVGRESKKPKTEQDSVFNEISTEKSKGEGQNSKDKHDSVTESEGASPGNSDLFKEVEEYANEIIQSSIDALSLGENKATDTNTNDGKNQSGSTGAVNEIMPNLAELSIESKNMQKEKALTDKITADIPPRLPGVSDKECSEEMENQDLLNPSIQQVMFEVKSEHMTSSVSSFTEIEIDSSPFLRNEFEQEMLTTAYQSPPCEFSDSTANEKVLEVAEKSCEESKTESCHLETDASTLPGNLLISPDYVVSPKFEVPPNTPASGCAEISQPAKLKNLNLMQNKAKLEKEVADLLSGLTLKFRHPVGSNLEEFQTDDSKVDANKDNGKFISVKSVEKESGDEGKDLPVQTTDSAIISANSFDTSVEELEKIDICVKHDLSAAEEGRCSPEEYLSLLQQVLPNVTSITKLKSDQEQEHGDVQCNVVSSSNNTDNHSLLSKRSFAEICKSPTAVVNVCDLSVAENVEVPCKLQADMETEISKKATEVTKEGLDADQDVFTSKDDLALKDQAMNRPEDPHNNCLSQSDGARLFKSMYEDKRPDSDVTKKRYNSAKSSTSKGSESDGQFTKLKMSKKLSKSDEKLKQTSKPPWNSNTKVDHGKTGNSTPSRIPKSSKTKSVSLSHTKQMGEKSKSVKGKSEDLPVEVPSKHYGGDVGSTDDAHGKNIDKEHHSLSADDKNVFSKERSVSSEKRRNADQAQKVLSEIEKGRCEMDQVERATEAKVDSSCQSVQASGNVEDDENQNPTASASTKEKPVPKWKSKNSKKSKGRQKNRW